VKLCLGHDLFGLCVNPSLGDAEDTSAPPKVFICRKPGGKSLKIREKWRTTLFGFKKWRPTFAEKHMKTFLRGHTKKVFMIFVGEICRKKPHEIL